jgi:hypothetical protein
MPVAGPPAGVHPAARRKRNIPRGALLARPVAAR